MSSQPAVLVEFNQYQYDLVPIVLKSGKTVKALRQVKQISSQEILDFSQVHIDMKMGEGADDFEITLNNLDGKYTDVFVPFQEIVLWVGFPTVAGRIVKSELTPLIYGLIDDAKPKFSVDSGETITVNGRNYASLLLENKLTENYNKMKSSDIVSDIVNQYGLGLPVVITQTTKLRSKSIATTSKASAIMQGKVSGDLKLSAETQNVFAKYGIGGGGKTGPNASLFKNKTAWEAIEYLSYLENGDSPDNLREVVAYFEGKTFYFGPRRNIEDDPSQLVQLQVGVNIEDYEFKQSTQFLKTSVTIKSREIKNNIPTKKLLIVTVPDDLVAGVDIDATMLKSFQDKIKLYGPRNIIIQDRDRLLTGGKPKLKQVGIAKLMEFSRLTFTGHVDFVFTSDLDNNKIGLLHKDMAVSVSGIPAATGSKVPPFEKPQSRLLNAIFYIENASHTISNSGYKVHLELSSRKPQMQKQISNATTGVSGVPVRSNVAVSEQSLQLESESVE